MMRHKHKKYPVRMPPELREQLTNEARRTDRSLHGEIVHRLRESFKQTDQQRMLDRAGEPGAAS